MSCKTENQVLAKLERDLSRKRRHKNESTRRSQGKKPDNR